ncbi:MAG: 3-phosphoshikimate 1-carboxyvinyltransferase [Flavobacteriaceae bacterium]|nr:3-phosphoshikimate 1-carboxyvinyltransferase [Flavobacteriaceae bacterium]
MNLSLNSARLKEAHIDIPGSKSESNRLLILSSLFKNLSLKNISNSDDTNYLLNALSSKSSTIDIGHAGTAMRFLTSYFSLTTKKEIELRGSQRMHNRPIKILVDSLREIGASIHYIDKEGYPPLLIKPSKLISKNLIIDSSTSSQYISSLLLIAPKISGGLKIQLTGRETSKPYIDMTISLLKKIGVKITTTNNQISVYELQKAESKKHHIESDWSSASYFYSVVALAEIGFSLKLLKFSFKSLQGDSKVADIYKSFGVKTIYLDDLVILKKIKSNTDKFSFDLTSNPDLAQTICVTCLGLGIKCNLTGLHTLKIKETDRLLALKKELSKFNLKVKITDDSISFDNVDLLKSNVVIETYDDHRMAMSFACLAVKVKIIIKDSEVVSKSYKSFWLDLKRIAIYSE